MVAAKLDHSRVLVTKFHQNRSTLKGRSAGERHTHADRQTRLKIRALQVCNQANTPTGNLCHAPFTAVADHHDRTSSTIFYVQVVAFHSAFQN